jgi:hypothetical protein
VSVSVSLSVRLQTSAVGCYVRMGGTRESARAWVVHERARVHGWCAIERACMGGARERARAWVVRERARVRVNERRTVHAR